MTPFVCQNTPFVRHGSSIVGPSVGLIIPPVGLRRFETGFTLVELMVTLVVVSILAFVAVPSISNIMKDHRVSGYTNDFVADLNFARSEAVKRALPVTVCKTADPQAASPACNTTDAAPWTTGRLVFLDVNSNGAVDSGDQVLRIRQALTDNKSVIKGNGSATGSANRITFRADGLTTLTAEAQIALCDDRAAAQHRAIAINATGRVRSLKKGTGAITCP